jgi:hypothetical protein
MKITWAILATLTMSSISMQVQAEESFPVVVTKGFHSNHKGLTETTDEKRGTRFSQEEIKNYNSNERKQDCFLGDHFCGREKKILEVGGILTYADGIIPADCAEVNSSAILQAIHKADNTVIDNNKSVSNHKGDKSRTPAGSFSDERESGNGSGKAGSPQ